MAYASPNIEHQVVKVLHFAPHPLHWNAVSRERVAQSGLATQRADLLTVGEKIHLSRMLSRLNGIPFRWPDFLTFVQDEWEQAETRLLQTDHSFIVAQHTVYQALRAQLAAMGRLC